MLKKITKELKTNKSNVGLNEHYSVKLCEKQLTMAWSLRIIWKLWIAKVEIIEFCSTILINIKYSSLL